MYPLLVSICALTLAVVALWRTFESPEGIKQVRRAFLELEEEWENQRDHVRSTLGRISRLRRGIMPTSVQAEGGTSGVIDAEPHSGGDLIRTDSPLGTALTPRQASIQSQILRRRTKGVTDGLLQR